jgi:hypothetical protein
MKGEINIDPTKLFAALWQYLCVIVTTYHYYLPYEFMLNNVNLFLAAIVRYNTQLNVCHCLIKESSFPFHLILPSFYHDLALEVQRKSNS